MQSFASRLHSKAWGFSIFLTIYIKRFIVKTRRAIAGVDSKKLYTILTLIMIGSTVIFILVYIAYFPLAHIFSGAEKLGQFGDFIGGSLNPIFGFLSLIAILLTLVLQSRELAATRTELSASRKAQELQAEILVRQFEVLQNKEKADVTFRMFDRWTSANVRISRLRAWEYFCVNVNLDNKDPIFIDKIRINSKDDYIAITEVAHFMADLYKMVLHNRVDEDLAYALFRNSLYPYYRYYKKILISYNEKNSNVSDADVKYYDGVSNFYREWVLGLDYWFKAKEDVLSFSSQFEPYSNTQS